MNQQNFDPHNRDWGLPRWRISASGLIHIELAWLAASGVIGWYLAGLPAESPLALAYRYLCGGNVLGLFVLGNAVGYLIYEEFQMVLSRIHIREQQEKAEREMAKAMAEVEAKKAEAAAERAAVVAEAVAAARADTAEVVAKAAEAAAKSVVEAWKAALDEGRQEGRRAAWREIAAWYQRLQAAQAEGRTFDEPPPGPPEVGGGNGGSQAG